MSDESKSAEPCVLVILGASGDLCKRLLMPTLYNLACDGLLPQKFAVVGMARDGWTTDEFRTRMSEGLATFHTRAAYDPVIGQQLVDQLHYLPGEFDDPAAYARLDAFLKGIEAQTQTGGNVLLYLATTPALFGLIADRLAAAGFVKRPHGWSRLIVEKPFGKDLASARSISTRAARRLGRGADLPHRSLPRQRDRAEHRSPFASPTPSTKPSGIASTSTTSRSPSSEPVGVEGRGGYYDKAGVLRDMIQNHFSQMISYVTMERPASFKAEAIRDAKDASLEIVRV